MPEVAENWPKSGGSKGFSNNLQNQAPTYKNKLIFGIYGSKQVEKKPSLTGKVAGNRRKGGEVAGWKTRRSGGRGGRPGA